MAVYYIACFVLGFLLFWFMTATVFASSFAPPPILRNKRIVLLIGHPDDEAMFFGPSVLALTSPRNNNHVSIVCLSTGNAAGQGEIRRGELLNSAHRLGIRSDEDVYVADDARFQDGAENDWRPDDIADFLAQRFAEQASSNSAISATTTSSSSSQTTISQSTPSNTAPDVILTFDPQGISLHPNHCACHTGATHFIRHHYSHSSQKPNDPPTPTLYILTSIPLVRKYLSILDIPFTILTMLTTTTTTTTTRRSLRPSTSAATANRIIFISGFRDYIRAFGAMVYAHKTQMLWFRWGWILVGRYMVVNDLRREEVVE